MKFYKTSWVNSILLFITVIAVSYLIYLLVKPTVSLPIINPTDVNPQLVDKSKQNINQNHKVADFKLINQNGDTITQEDYNNKIYVTDFFFTRCPTICPVMTNNMKKLQDIFKDNNNVMFLSLSVTPEIDSISVLRAYANDKGVMDAKWNITTGEKKHIYNLARKSYFSVVDEGDGGLQDFIHTTQFVLVDKEKRIRGIYDGTNTDEIQRLVKAIEFLLD